MEFAVQSKNVSKKFRVKTPSSLVTVIRETVLGSGHNSNSFYALKDINFEVKKGELIGLIGRNGAGKTTLLKLIARLIQPNQGNIIVAGEVTYLGGYGIGMVDDLTVKENIYLYGAIYGMMRDKIKTSMHEIIDWAELQKFSETKLKHLSSGMRTRLAFSTTRFFDTDIFLLDEALSAGDKIFQEKCNQVFESYKNSGTTFIISSHNLEFIKKFCNRTLWLHQGQILDFNDTAVVLEQYAKVRSF